MVSLVLVFEVAVAVGLVVGVVTMRPGVLVAVFTAVLVVLLAAYMQRPRPVGLAEATAAGDAAAGDAAAGDAAAESEPACTGTGVRVPVYAEQTYGSIKGTTDSAHMQRLRPTPGTRAPPLEQREAFVRAHKESMGTRDSPFNVRA